ncbi:MAG: hypothetical protein QOE95_2479 [Gaiellaceae bacterium]|nr:hypothetical protein [Gaiellaceae bacterium]
MTPEGGTPPPSGPPPAVGPPAPGVPPTDETPATPAAPPAGGAPPDATVIDLGVVGASENITLSERSVSSSVQTADPTREILKESGARVVAYALVGTLSGAVLITLLICLAIVAWSGSPDRTKQFTDAVTPLFEAVTKLASTVFGPLLAFVLGYYFSKEQSQKTT